jgi:hypothetical protein
MVYSTGSHFGHRGIVLLILRGKKHEVQYCTVWCTFVSIAHRQLFRLISIPWTKMIRLKLK